MQTVVIGSLIYVKIDIWILFKKVRTIYICTKMNVFIQKVRVTVCEALF